MFGGPPVSSIGGGSVLFGGPPVSFGFGMPTQPSGCYVAPKTVSCLLLLLLLCVCVDAVVVVAVVVSMVHYYPTRCCWTVLRVRDWRYLELGPGEEGQCTLT